MHNSSRLGQGALTPACCSFVVTVFIPASGLIIIIVVAVLLLIIIIVTAIIRHVELEDPHILSTVLFLFLRLERDVAVVPSLMESIDLVVIILSQRWRCSMKPLRNSSANVSRYHLRSVLALQLLQNVPLLARPPLEGLGSGRRLVARPFCFMAGHRSPGPVALVLCGPRAEAAARVSAIPW